MSEIDRESSTLPALARAAGVVLLIVGLAAFLIQFQHSNAFTHPSVRNVLLGLLSMGLGGALVRFGPRATGPLRIAIWIGVAISPLVLFQALYATFAELEEVVVLRVVDEDGQPASLRLWIVDDAGSAWVTMPQAKASTHGLGVVDVELLRAGQLGCIRATRIDDRAQVSRVHHLRHEKYSVQRLATAVGLFDREPDPTTVALRLDPCSD